MKYKHTKMDLTDDKKVSAVYDRVKNLSMYGLKIVFEQRNGRQVDPYTNDPEDKNDILFIHWGDSIEMIEKKIEEKEAKYANCDIEFQKAHFIKLLNRCKNE